MQYSQRTDNGQAIRQLPDAKYGENRDFVRLQRAAPLADGPDRAPALRPAVPTAPGQAASPGPPGATPPPEITPLTAPSAYPNQPVTTGMQRGPAAPRQRPEIQPGQLSAALAPYIAADPTGVLRDFAFSLSDMGL